ncbi:MAG: gliding motility-associated C-terminal domain-containing protein [Bacteroidota bacterium]
MKKEILLLFCIIMLNVFSRAQSTFVKTFGGNQIDQAQSAIHTLDGNFLLIGRTINPDNGNNRGYIAKVNRSAKEIWDKTIEAPGDIFLENGIQLQNGDFLLVGWTSNIGQGDSDVLLVRIDRFGNIIWTQTYGGARGDAGYALLETSDGNIVVAGETSSDLSSNKDILLLKLEQNGSEIWSRSYGGPEDDSSSEIGLIEDDLGNYILTSSWTVFDNVFDTEGLIMVVNPSGVIVRIKTYNSGPENKLESCNAYVEQTASGFLNIGTIRQNDSRQQEIWMSDFAMDGSINWSRSFALSNAILSPKAVTALTNGNYVIAGNYELDIPDDEMYAFLLEISGNGDVVWSKTYGGAGLSELNSVFSIDDGYISFGYTNTEGVGSSDVFMVRTDDFGTISGCSSELSITVSDLNANEDIPNPVVESLAMGEVQNFTTNTVNFEERVVCDGCSANDLEAGLICENAPVICSIDCLDGFTSTLPNDLILPQPEMLCENAGIPNNMSWFAFVAGSNVVDLSIIPTNCTTIYGDDGSAQTIGIQAGIFADCSFENSMVCHTDYCMDLIAETVNLASDQFIEGQTYYLFVDGCGGSVCDYEVIVNSAQQAFEMDEITTISNNLGLDLDQDTLCAGSEITFTLDDFDQSVNFNWSINPPTSEFPLGIHSVNDTNVVTFQFDEEGCFDIHVYAFNDCDNSETRTFSVCVKQLKDETFTDIYVCQECFPISLVAPESGCIITESGGAPTVLIEDPNGDGVPGWLGTSAITGPGLASNMVTNNLGCSYTQYVNVFEIPLSPREEIEYYFCLFDFPQEIDGYLFDDPGDSRNITIPGGAASGCDSLIRITANAIDFWGGIGIGNCESGEVELSFEIQNISPEHYDSVTYTWLDEFLNEVTDSDGIDSILTVNEIGTYSVQVAVVVDGESCPQSFGPVNVDIDNLAPTIPNIAYSPIDICVSEEIAIIYMASQELGETYIWDFTPEVPFTFGLSSDTVYVDVTEGMDFEFCVYAENGCGSSNEICDQVNVVASPDSEFSVDTQICIDSFAVVLYTGATEISNTTSFHWDFDGGVIRNGMDPNSGGPFEIEFPAAGQYSIRLMLSEVGCNSMETEYIVEVYEPFVPPSIDCSSDVGSVTFLWDNTGVDDIDIIILSDQTSGEQIDNTFTVSNLNSEEEVSIRMIFNQNEICGPAMVIENCTSLPCPDVTFDLSLSAQDLCPENLQNVTLDAMITGDDSGSGFWESPFLANEFDFSTELAGIGEHLVTFNYELGDCIYSKDTLIRVHPSPEVDFEISLSYCEEMGSNLVDIYTDSNHSVFLDGEVLSVLEGVEVEIGDHLIEVESLEGCVTSREFAVEASGVESLLITGNLNIIKGESEDYRADIVTDLIDLVLIWTLNSDTICVNCEEITLSPEANSELCVSVEYGDGCLMEDCMQIEVNEKTKLFIPNAFSPNNDNINDHFILNSNNSLVFIKEVMIFDRWGEMVYNQQNFNLSEDSFSWDGRKNGQLCTAGVYVYIISFMDEENQPKKITGDLTLVR